MNYDRDKERDRNREKDRDRYRDSYRDRGERDREERYSGDRRDREERHGGERRERSERDRGERDGGDRERSDRDRDRGDRDRSDRDRDRGDRDRDRDRSHRSERKRDEVDYPRERSRERRRERSSERYKDSYRRDDSKRESYNERKRITPVETRNEEPESKRPKNDKVEAESEQKLQQLLDEKKSSIEERLKKLMEKSSAASSNPLVANKSMLFKTVHPSLTMDPMTKTLEMKKAATNVLLPKANFATVKANVRGAQKNRELKLEPVKLDNIRSDSHFDRSIGLPSKNKLVRRNKRLKFAVPGKFVAEAEQMRLDEQRKILEKKIAETTERTGINLDITESLAKLEKVPDAEWWDCQFLPSASYEDLDEDKISYELVTHLVHHPIPFTSGSSSKAQEPRPLMLTKKEMKRMRRQRRMEELKDKQERIRIGLLPPEKPKVKLSNIMRVLGNQAIQDPSRTEAMVRLQMQERLQLHQKTNEEHKLTKEEARAKKIRKLQEDTSDGVTVAVFKVKNLSNPKCQFKVDINAQQNYLSGVCILQKHNNLVIVEGGPKAIRRYKNLMLNRINWNENNLVLGNPSNDASTSAQSSASSSPNECHLVWEGIAKKAAFSNFTVHDCAMEVDAKSILAEAGVEYYWKYGKEFKAPTLDVV